MNSQRARILGLGISVLAACSHPTTSTPAPAAPRPPPAVVGPPPVQDVATADTDSNALVSRVTRVTVYSDRARVTREAIADATAAPAVFAFRGLPGWVDDGSVQVSASGGRIADVRVDRAFLARATDAGWQKVEAEHKALADRMATLQDEAAVLDAQKAQIEAIKAFSLAKITQDTVIGNVSVQSYGDVLRFITDSLRTTAVARRALQRQVDELAPELDASRRRVEDAKDLMTLEETTVLVTLQAAAPGPVTIELTYMLPGVTWEPMHELRAGSADPKNVEIVSYAAVTQTSGEDWGGAELAFSTQSTTRSVRVPELEALTLGDTHTASRILTSQITSFTRAQQAFSGQSQLWNSFHNATSAERARANFEQVYQSNIEYLQTVQSRTVSLFESLERRGTTAHFKAQAVQSVRGDGHPVKLLIGTSALASTEHLVAAPEQSLNAARTRAMTNGAQPILPGRVALYQDGTFLGLTDIEFIAPGEGFSLFFGVADHLKLSRELDRKRSSLVRKTRNQMQIAFVVTVENLAAVESTFTLTDRIPVSENKDIRVERVTITPAVRPDSQGLLRWEITLQPGEKRELRIAYQVEYPAELVIETKRRRAMEPASPSPATRSRNEDQILDLETNF